MVAYLHTPTTSSSAITSIEESKALRLSASSSPIRSNTLTTSFSFEETMNVLPSIEFMASTTNASAALVFGFGSSSLIASTASRWPPSSMTRYSACMVHGLSPELQYLDQIRQIERPVDVPDQGLLCDLLWSDPDREIKGWKENDRGVSYTFGADRVSEFLRKLDLDLICRAHQVVEDGYEFFADRQLVTIFSAPNYCGEYNNAGALMSVDASLLCSFQILKPYRGKVGGQLDRKS